MGNAEKHFELAVGLSRDVLKALLIVNGGAATALIALMDKTAGSKDYTPAIIAFGIGTVLAVISSCFGYFSQLFYANHRMEVEENGDGSKPFALHGRWQIATIIAVMLTLACAVVGITLAAWVAGGK